MVILCLLLTTNHVPNGHEEGSQLIADMTELLSVQGIADLFLEMGVLNLNRGLFVVLRNSTLQGSYKYEGDLIYLEASICIY